MVSDNQLTIIIVTFNNQETINECLSSILKYSEKSHVIVVDNNSTDETRKILAEFKKVKVIESKENLGFAKANNLAAKTIVSKYIVFLNPDTELTQAGNLSRMAQLIEENNEIGIVGPRVIYQDKSIQKTIRNLPNLWRAIKEYILWIKGEYDFYIPECTNPCEVESIKGACLVIKKDVFNLLNGLDERYFVYYEDLQLSKDIKDAHFKVVYDPLETIIHIEGASGKKIDTYKILNQSAKKYHGLVEYYLIQLVIRIGNLLNR